MGIFDSISKIVKNVVEDTANDVMQNVKETILGNDTTTSHSTSSTSSPQTSTTSRSLQDETETFETNQDQKAGLIEFRPESMANSRIITSTIYDTDESGFLIEVEQTFVLFNDFIEVDSSAGEVECCYSYAPGCTEDETEFYEDSPYITIGFDTWSEKIVSNYVKNFIIKKDTSIDRVTNSFVEYKTTMRYHNSQKLDTTLIAYHFHRGVDQSRYIQISLHILTSLLQTSVGQLAIQTLDQLVSTYKENKTNSLS